MWEVILLTEEGKLEVNYHLFRSSKKAEALCINGIQQGMMPGYGMPLNKIKTLTSCLLILVNDADDREIANGQSPEDVDHG